MDLNYPILSDPDRKVAEKYGVVSGDAKFAKRWTFYIDKEGVVRFIDQKVNAKSHGDDVLKKLKELGIAD